MWHYTIHASPDTVQRFLFLTYSNRIRTVTIHRVQFNINQSISTEMHANRSLGHALRLKRIRCLPFVSHTTPLPIEKCFGFSLMTWAPSQAKIQFITQFVIYFVRSTVKVENASDQKRYNGQLFGRCIEYFMFWLLDNVSGWLRLRLLAARTTCEHNAIAIETTRESNAMPSFS